MVNGLAAMRETASVDIDYRSSLARRVRTVHALYLEAVDSMSLEQVNHAAHPGVLPIAFSLVHHVLIEDSSRFFAGGSRVVDDGWTARINVAVASDGKEETVDTMMNQRIGDYVAFRALQVAVYDATEAYIESLDPERFDDVLVAPPYPPRLANTFSARLGAQAGITRSDAIESWIYQHALRHLGEIEHARALVGLRGLTS